jgi:hypothetical protein
MMGAKKLRFNNPTIIIIAGVKIIFSIHEYKLNL